MSLSDSLHEASYVGLLLFCPFIAAQMMRAALRAAHERNQTFVDERVMDETLSMISGPA